MVQGRSLLLVEDDDTTREVLSLLLEQEGWSVIGANSGEAALDALRSPPVPRAILCDLHLPGIQGAELAHAIRALAPSARVLAMSASALPETPGGYDALLLKPFHPADVEMAVNTTTGNQATEFSADSNVPVLSMDTVLKLEQQMGTRAKDLYAFALADAGDRLDRMAKAAGQPNADVFHKEAHALKGSAGMIGAERLAALAGQAEMFDLEKTVATSEKILQGMRLACAEIRLMLETLFPV